MITGRVREILKYPADVLRQKALPAADVSSEYVQQVIHDLKTTVAKGGDLGLAAPQIGESVRAFVMRTPLDRLREQVPAGSVQGYTTCINPRITAFSKKQRLGLEGCLSLPEQQAIVRRHVEIGVEFLDEAGNLVRDKLAGLPAIVFQHEFDHLDGVLIIDREIKHFEKMTYDQAFDKAYERYLRHLAVYYDVWPDSSRDDESH